MTENAPARTRGWVKALLVASLALNLAVAGVAAGAWLRHAGPMRAAPPADMGYGPVARALSREDRHRFREGLVARLPDLRQGPQALRADFDRLLQALRQEPFAPEQLRAALETMSGRNIERLRIGQELLGEMLIGMEPRERAAFADRLERTLKRPPPSGSRTTRKDDAGGKSGGKAPQDP